MLWSVPARGRSLVRELRAFSRIEASELPDPPPGAEVELPDGALAAGGYVMSPETVAALQTLELAELMRTAPAPRRVLLLEREGRTPDDELVAAFEEAGAAVTVGPGPGFTQMVMVPPQEAKPPTEVFEQVADWLEAEGGGAVADGLDEHAGVLSVYLDEGGARIRETALTVEQPFGRLLGVLAEPADAQADLCVVLLNAGPQRRTGPNRMWVEIARRWAARGVPTLRIDLGGIGDSDGDASRFESDEAFYEPHFVGQARAALDVLEARGLAPRFVLGGLCSGAYWSLYAAIEDERIPAALLLNPRALLFDGWTEAVRETRELRRKLFSGNAWRRALRGEVSYSRPFRIAGRFLLQVALAPFRLPRRIAARLRARAVGGDEIDLVFDRLRDQGKRALMVFVGREPLHEEFVRDGRLARFERWPNIDLEVRAFDAETHTLRPLWLQRAVHAMVDEAIERELAPEGPAAALPEGARR